MGENDSLERLLFEINAKMQVIDERTKHILTQAEKTNGRVSKHDDQIQAIERKAAQATGYAFGISAVVGILWSAVNFVFK